MNENAEYILESDDKIIAKIITEIKVQDIIDIANLLTKKLKISITIYRRELTVLNIT